MKQAEGQEKEALISQILTRGVEDIFVKESLEKRLRSEEKLRVKLGFDPTSPNIHIGRAIVLRKLRLFQKLGHTPVFIVGDFTAQIGDPSDKLSKRPMLSKEEITQHLASYKDQVGKIIDLTKAEFHYNSEWLSKLSFAEITTLAESFSIQQMLARRNFKERHEKGEEISLREFLYPMMQGYDSVAVKSDIELGGFDQLFNLKAGRVIQKHYRMPEQDVLTTAMLEGTDGRKMSSSWGNIIAINDEPNDMYGKVMSVRDDLISKYFLLCTDLSEADIATLMDSMKNGANPRDVKMRLAREIVTLYHSADAAEKAEQYFVTAFSEGKVPEDVREVSVEKGALFVDLLLKEGIVESKSEFRRLIDEGAIGYADTGEKIEDPKAEIQKSGVVRVGKKRFIKLSI